MDVEGNFGIRHDAAGEMLGLLMAKAAPPIDRREFANLGLGVIAKRLTFDCQLSLYQLVLGSHAHPFAGRHRNRSGEKPADPRKPHQRPIGGCAGDAQNESDVGDQSVADPEHRGSGGATLNVAVTVNHVVVVIMIVLGSHDVSLPRFAPRRRKCQSGNDSMTMTVGAEPSNGLRRRTVGKPDRPPPGLEGITGRRAPLWQDRAVSNGRFAPSPTGNLHVGNLRTALAAWLWTRHDGGQIRLRFEDLDVATARPEFERNQLHDLLTLGLDFDGKPVRQSERLPAYRDAIAKLEQDGLAYRCWCSRKEVREAAAAPHGPPGHYPGTCRDLTVSEISEKERSGRPPALRLRTSNEPYEIFDEIHGAHRQVVDDFVLRRGDGTPAYNLAVVVDDAAHDVDQVARGDDLLASTPRQAHLYDLLGWTRPRWMHVPLVLGPDGQRLAKRHGAVTLTDRLDVGDTPRRVAAVLARSLGLPVPEPEIDPVDLLERFSPDQIGRSAWTLAPEQINNPW